MALTSSAPIKRALVETLRANATLKAALKGGIHEGFAPTKVQYPVLTYQLVYAPYLYLWGSAMLFAGVDINIWAPSGVDANNVDALVLTTLDDQLLPVDGQTTLICRRVADLGSQDTDEEGRKIYMVGGTYEIWTDQVH